MVGPGVPVGLDALADGLRVPPSDDFVDKAVTATVFEILRCETEQDSSI